MEDRSSEQRHDAERSATSNHPRRGRPTGRRPTGRRPGGSRSREEILAAARSSFAENGYDATTIRAVAARAGVDPALVHYFFGAKKDLFAAAMALPVTPAELTRSLLAEGTEGLGERLARTVVQHWDEPSTGGPLLALLRSAASQESSAQLLREFVAREVLGRLASAIGLPDAAERAGLAGSQIVGLAMSRYVLRMEPLASADPETLVSYLAPTLQYYLTGDLPSPRRQTRRPRGRG